MLADNHMADVNATAITPSKHGFRILVVDDNQDSALSLAMMLSIMGHETRTAHDGESAVVTGESFLPEVVVVEIGLPKLNGYEVAHRIRAPASGEYILLIAVTGWRPEQHPPRSSEVALNVHMAKPLAPAALE